MFSPPTVWTPNTTRDVIHHFFSVISPLTLVTAELPPMWWESENLILVEDVGSKKLNHQPTKSTQADVSEPNLNLAKPLIAAEASDLNNNGDNFAKTIFQVGRDGYSGFCKGSGRGQVEGTSIKTPMTPFFEEHRISKWRISKHLLKLQLPYCTGRNTQFWWLSIIYCPCSIFLFFSMVFHSFFGGSTQQVTDRNSSRCPESRVEEL